jgi:phage shock protein E
MTTLPRRLAPLAASAALSLAASIAHAAPPAAWPPSGLVDGPTAKALVARGARLVDVRTPAEFAGGHVSGAVNVSHEQVEARAGELGPRDTPVVLYCRTGRRTAVAAAALARLGYTRVYDLQGISNWPQ